MTLSQSLRSPSLWTAIALALLVGFIGAEVTALGDWYAQLRKPAFQPPDWLFGPVWTLIFLLTAASAHRLWEASVSEKSARIRIVILFLFNAGMNVLWSALFFALQRPDIALFQAFVLLVSVLLIMKTAAADDAIARWMLAPYAAWVVFAITLNAAIVRLNAPFT
ncbi:MAG: TspO/MBR family protein [Pseudomonadota bacterium]